MTLQRRFRQHLELMNGRRLLSNGCSETIGSRIPASNYHHPLACGNNLILTRNVFAGETPVLLSQVIHGKMNAPQLSAGNAKIAWPPNTDGNQSGIVSVREFICRNVFADIHSRQELNLLTTHLVQPSIDNVFFKLEIGNAVPEQATHAVVLFENRNGMPGARQLLCRGKTGRT